MSRKQYGGERRNINLALSEELIQWIDEVAGQADVSRTWLIAKLLECSRAQEHLGFVRIGREGVSFANLPLTDEGMAVGTSQAAIEAHRSAGKSKRGKREKGLKVIE